MSQAGEEEKRGRRCLENDQRKNWKNFVKLSLIKDSRSEVRDVDSNPGCDTNEVCEVASLSASAKWVMCLTGLG